MNKEPTVIANGIAELIRLIIPALILFGIIHWTGEQVAGLMAVIGFAATFVATLFTRSSVVPVSTANEQIKLAIQEPKSSTVKDVIEKFEEKKDAETIQNA